MSELKAILFDCDGVLAETERDGHRVAFNQTFSDFGLDIEWQVDEYAEYVKIGGGKNRVRRYFDARDWQIDGLPKNKSERDSFIDALHKHKSEAFVKLVDAGKMSPRPGVNRLIKEALANDIKVAIASSSARISVQRVLSLVVDPETAESIPVFGGEDVKLSKPDPEIYLCAMKALGVKPTEAVVVEDSSIGCQAGAAAGCQVLVTPSFYSHDEDFSDANTIVTCIGSSENPATFIAGEERVITKDSIVTVQSLRHLLK